MNNNRCVMCLQIIPEGRQVCPSCERLYSSSERGFNAMTKRNPLGRTTIIVDMKPRCCSCCPFRLQSFDFGVTDECFMTGRDIRNIDKRPPKDCPIISRSEIRKHLKL